MGRPDATLAWHANQETVLRYRGILDIDEVGSHGGLAVELGLSDRTLTVTSDGEVLGRYPIDDIGVTRVGSDRFDLRVGTDQLVFTADDAIRFSYEAVPAIESARTHRAHSASGRIRSWLSRPAAADGTVRAVTPAGRAFTPAEAVLSLAEMREKLEEMASVDSSSDETDEVPVPRPMSVPESRREVPESGSPLGCVGIRSDGGMCGADVVTVRGFCRAHDPDNHRARHQAEDETTQAATRVRRLAADNLDDVVARLERAVAEVHEGKLDPQQALAMASLAHAMVETIELAKSKEAQNRTT